MPRFRPHWPACLLSGLGLLLVLLPGQRVQAAETGVAVFLGIAADGKPLVIQFDPNKPPTELPKQGLVVWATGDRPERWQTVTAGWSLPRSVVMANGASASGGATRGGGSGSGGADGGQMTVQLEQLQPGFLKRDLGPDALLTPEKGSWLLVPRPTFRRLPRAKEPKLLPLVVLLSGKSLSEPVRLEFKAGQAAIAYKDVQGLPKELPAGEYFLGREDEKKPTRNFFIEKEKDREPKLRRIEEMAALLDPESDLFLSFATQHLLGMKDAQGDPYFQDALDRLDAVPEKNLTPALQGQKKRLLDWLQLPRKERNEKMLQAAAPGEPTGIEEIEQARRLIGENKWSDAESTLEEIEKGASDKRTRGLAQLYRGVVLTESGFSNETAASNAFKDALANLKEPDDRFRAFVNYAGFLQQTAQDRLSNHAMQMAVGVERPFLTALQAWLQARQRYDEAASLIDAKKKPASQAVIAINQARLYALLADFVRTLDFPAAGQRAHVKIEEAAVAQALKLAAQAGQLVEKNDNEAGLRGLASEIQAHLSFRSGKDQEASRLASLAQTQYLQAGNLAGIENLERLQGLLMLRQADAISDDVLAGLARNKALKHLRVAQTLSESLRERFPPEKAGLTRAGFFARKAYVHEKIVEVLLRDGRTVEALQQLEMAKARGLQDLLATNHTKEVPLPARKVADMLKNWPKDAAVVEYFLGAEQAWVFVVGTDGKVQAHRLRDREGKPVSSRDLIGRVQRFLVSMEGAAGKLRDRMLAGQGIDNSWQTDLEGFRGELLPDEALKELRKAKVAVVVPQHILHYFPFAALVTQIDKEATPKKMAKPQFLLNEEFSLIAVPSLTSWDLRRQLKPKVIKVVNAVGLEQAPDADPLPGVEKDLQNLREVFKQFKPKVLDGKDALEAKVKTLLEKEPGLLFLATHGFNDADRPLESHLLLLPDPSQAGKVQVPGANVNDGRLTAAEIFLKPVNADLVILSACYSGLGDRSPLPGDDLFGLQRAFLQGGVQTVVAGLWDVYDETAPQLMNSVFQGLAEGKPACVALADAQRSFLKERGALKRPSPFLHPYFWAVYTVSGDDRTKMAR